MPTFELKLTSRSPGLLKVEELSHRAQTHPPRDVRRPRHHHDRLRRGGRGRSRAQCARAASGHHRVRDTADHGGRFRKRADLAADRSRAIPDRRSPARSGACGAIRLAADAGLADSPACGCRWPPATTAPSCGWCCGRTPNRAWPCQRRRWMMPPASRWCSTPVPQTRSAPSVSKRRLRLTPKTCPGRRSWPPADRRSCR